MSPAQIPNSQNATTDQTSATTASPSTLYGGVRNRRVTVRDLANAKARGEKWSMLTAYDAMTASVFDESGTPVLLVGDSMGNCHLGYDTTVPVTMDEMAVLSAAVVRGTRRALVVADLPFGAYQEGSTQALRNAMRLVKDSGVGAVKLEGGQRSLAQTELLASSGIPVMAHLGLTQQSVNSMGYRVQGRSEQDAHELLRDAKAAQEAGAFAVVLEMVPTGLAAEVSEALEVPTIGIGAGPHCDAQVLVWTDLAGLTPGKPPRFSKQYAQLRETLGEAAQAFATEVSDGSFPLPEHSFN